MRESSDTLSNILPLAYVDLQQLTVELRAWPMVNKRLILKNIHGLSLTLPYLYMFLLVLDRGPPDFESQLLLNHKQELRLTKVFMWMQ